MEGRLRKAVYGGSIAAIVLATAACGPDEAATTSAPTGQFSLFDPIGANAWPGGLPEAAAEFSEADYFGDALPPLPQAAPMARSAPGRSYGYAPDYYEDYPVDEPVYYDDLAGDDSYAWLALASALGGVFGDAPPDYYFDYDGGVDPWVWETGDHFVRYAEPLDYGYRYYYYSPGRSYPFLVRDPYYSYGYYDNRVAVIYDRDGRVLDGRRSWRQRQVAERYYTRARDLHEAWRQRPRRGIAAPLWDQQRTTFAREQRQWDEARVQHAGWRAWDRRNERTLAPRWTGERVARTYAAQRFDRWRDEGYRGQAPRFYREAQRSARLQQAVREQRAERRGEARGFVQREERQRAALWSQDRGAPRADSSRLRNEAQADRVRARQERFAAQRETRAERREASPFREAQVRREQARQERRAVSDRRIAAAREGNRAAAQARGEARSQPRSSQAQAVRQRRQDAAVRQSQMTQRAQAMSQARQQRAEQRRTLRRSEAQGQPQRQARPMQAQRSEARQQARAQRVQAMTQARQQRSEQNRVVRQERPRQESFATRRQVQRDPGQAQARIARGGGGRESRGNPDRRGGGGGGGGRNRD